MMHRETRNKNGKLESAIIKLTMTGTLSLQGNYEEATKYFDKAYNLSRSMGETAAININRVQFGIAMAHKMMPGFGGHVVLNKLPTVERLIEWKSSRVDEFEKPIPEPG